MPSRNEISMFFDMRLLIRCCQGRCRSEKRGGSPAKGGGTLASLGARRLPAALEQGRQRAVLHGAGYADDRCGRDDPEFTSGAVTRLFQDANLPREFGDRKL